MAEEEHVPTTGTLVITLIFLAVLLLVYIVNWIWLSNVWHFSTP